MFSKAGREKTLVVHTCEVNQGLLSISKVFIAGNRLVFDNATGFIESKRVAMRLGFATQREWSPSRCEGSGLCTGKAERTFLGARNTDERDNYY